MDSLFDTALLRKLAGFRRQATYPYLNLGLNSGLNLGLVALSALLVSGCASESYDSNPSYTQNTFYTGAQAEAPSHPRRAKIDFFNKVCESSGSSNEPYSCHYTDD